MADETVEIAPQDEAKRLIELAQDAERQRAALIASLTQRRADIDAALVALGAKRGRKRGPGRPVGSRTRKAKGPEVVA